jgi:hypothetical protein
MRIMTATVKESEESKQEGALHKEQRTESKEQRTKNRAQRSYLGEESSLTE